MNVEQVKAEIIKMPQFSKFEWLGDKDNFATMEVSSRTFRDENRSEVKLLSPYLIFIAHMYEGQADKEFFYILVWRKGQVREFRKHNFNDIEFNKIYVSGKTIKEVVSNLQEKFDNGYEFV